MKEQISLTTIYVALLGSVALAFGIADILVWAGVLNSIEIGILTIGGDDFFRWAWGGLVLTFGGILMLSGAQNIYQLQQFSKAFLGAVMVWIIAFTDIFATVCENIPAGEETPAFFNSLYGFFSGFLPPYTPAVLLLPFTFLLAYGVYTWNSDESKRDLPDE